MQIETLRQRWRLLIDADQVFEALIAAYAQPNRFYHTIEHVEHILHVIDCFRSLTSNGAQLDDSRAVYFAAWFHDAVYDSQAKDNEASSAEFAKTQLSKVGISSTTIEKVTQMILSTKSHQPSKDLDTQVLLDADLAILGTESPLYWNYALAIRKEYAWLSDTDYRTGRSRVLKNFLQRDRIYWTAAMFEQYESIARKNLQAEVQFLTQPHKNSEKDVFRTILCYSR